MKDYIRYYKWDQKENNTYIQSCNSKLNLLDSQIYMPFFSLFFYIHNTKNSNKIIDIDRRFYIKNLLDIKDNSYYNSNKIINAELYDIKYNKTYSKNIFAKCIPILDPLNTMMNNYKLNDLKNLPSNYIYNSQSKINNINNSCYIEVLLTYITSNLYLNNILPFFPLYYGSINGITNNYKLDISDEYSDFCNERWFQKNIDNIFSIDLYVSDSDSESNNSYNSNNTFMNNTDELIANFNNIPVQYLFIEKLEGTLEDLFYCMDSNILKSCLFQINFILLYLQKNLKFTHNDLHINNIMYVKTNTKFLYYKYNNKYFKVPTHGYLFTIIDFGRSIFEYKDKLYFNDVFSKYGEAEGQYTYPLPNINLYKNNNKELENIYPNYSFDMCRLVITILEELNHDILDNDTLDFLNLIVTDINNNNIFINKVDSFELYINIAKYSNNGIPFKLINNKYFNNYQIKKKLFPINNFYKS